MEPGELLLRYPQAGDNWPTQDLSLWVHRLYSSFDGLEKVRDIFSPFSFQV